jgi:hypothetical protein
MSAIATWYWQRSMSRFFNPLRKRSQRAKKKWPHFRPRLEALEDRLAPALSVTLTGTTVTLDETAGLQNDDTNAPLPTAFSDRLAALGAPATEINHAVSNGNVISITGVTGTITNIAFTDASGHPLDGAASGLSTTDGEAISLFTDTVNDNIVLGKTAAGAIAFAVYIEETGSPVNGGKFWSIEYEALHHPDATNPDDSIDLGSNLKVAVSEGDQLRLRRGAVRQQPLHDVRRSEVHPDRGDREGPAQSVPGREHQHQGRAQYQSSPEHHLVRRQRKPDQSRPTRPKGQRHWTP